MFQVPTKYLDNHEPTTLPGRKKGDSKRNNRDPGFNIYLEKRLYHKDTEPFIPCFHVLTSITSFQYLSIHAMTFIACYNYMLARYLIGITKSIFFVVPIPEFTRRDCDT